MTERKSIDDFDRNRLKDALHLQQRISRVVRRDLRKNAWNARAFLWPLALWVLGMSTWCCFAQGDWLPQFVVNKLSATGVSPEIEAFGPSAAGFLRALYYNTAMLSSVGASDFTPFNTASRAVSLLDSIAGVVTLGLVVSLLALSFEQDTDDRPSPGQAGDASTSDPTPPMDSGPDGPAIVATQPVTGASDPSFRAAVEADALRRDEARESDTPRAARHLTPSDSAPAWQDVALWGWQASIASRARSLADRMKEHIAASTRDKQSDNEQRRHGGTDQEDTSQRVEVPTDVISGASGIFFDLQSLPDRHGALALTLELNRLLIASKATVEGNAIDLAEADAVKIEALLDRAVTLATAYVLSNTTAGNGPARRRKFL